MFKRDMFFMLQNHSKIEYSDPIFHSKDSVQNEQDGKLSYLNVFPVSILGWLCCYAAKRDITRKLIGVGVCFLAWGSLLFGQEHPQCSPTEFLISVGETTSDLSHNGITSGDSILVLPDGSFQLQRRKQQLPSSTVTLKIFESRLSETQMQKLRSFLESSSVRNLPPYTAPELPLNAPWFGAFDVKIKRDSGIQRIGFWIWRGGTPATSPNTTPDETKKLWRDSQIALQPLIEWFHEIEAMKLEPSTEAKPMRLCEVEDAQQ